MLAQSIADPCSEEDQGAVSLNTKSGAEFTLAAIERQSLQAETFLEGFNEPTMEEKGAPENYTCLRWYI